MGRACLAALSLLPGAALGQAQPPLITWMQADTPPFHIDDGPLAGQGIKDRQFHFLAEHLPQFRHHLMVASVARNWYAIEHSDGVCIIGVASTAEREKFTLYSRRRLTGFGSRVIIRREDSARFAAFLDPQGEIDLGALSRSTALAGGFVSMLHYAEPIGAFLDDPKRTARLDKFVTPPQLFNVLKAKRVDYVFGQAVEAAYYAQPGELTALQIKGTGAIGGGLGIGCSNGELGRKVIKAIDALLADDQMWSDYIRPYGDWSLGGN